MGTKFNTSLEQVESLRAKTADTISSASAFQNSNFTFIANPHTPYKGNIRYGRSLHNFERLHESYAGYTKVEEHLSVEPRSRSIVWFLFHIKGIVGRSEAENPCLDVILIIAATTFSVCAVRSEWTLATCPQVPRTPKTLALSSITASTEVARKD